MNGTAPAVPCGGWQRATRVDCTPAAVPPVEEFRSARTVSHMGLEHRWMSQRVVRSAGPTAANGHGEEQTVFWGCEAARGGVLRGAYALILMGGWNAARIQPYENQVRQAISATATRSETARRAAARSYSCP